MGRPGGRSIKVGAANACGAMLISLKKRFEYSLHFSSYFSAYKPTGNEPCREAGLFFAAVAGVWGWSLYATVKVLEVPV
jgi:hypothetical protein